ncbi:Alpha/Beta hydrolase protein [Clohesyomyces aquaticus]|uniref:Alpha/Beta hydrolase protein n=1 Tax=Clohesyomyces aquaticus TaxID=1231657 RepID=A0A1Y1ZK32_9PLEO|nr:Alpha/Beta hydrolase protein [Clohesyomyces aquaticus]
MEKFIKSSLARRVAATSAQQSAAVSASVHANSAANSAGASTNLAEISLTLDTLLNRLTENERLSIGEENVATRLQRLCEQYPQSHAPTHLSEWQSDRETLEIVHIAADCAESVYARKHKTVIPGISLPSSSYDLVHQIAATAAGDFKATAIRVHNPSRTLVVAIRGTNKTSPIDWITNANGEPVDATGFLSPLPEVKAHSGFLYVAQSMVPDILSAIGSYTEPLDRICFAGHSAGGAVAALLYLHFQLSHSLAIPGDCITFAAPPVISIPNVHTNPDLQSPNTCFLALVTHGDPVPRADRPYIRQLLQLYSNPSDLPRDADFHFDPPELWNAGNPIILFDKNPDGDEEQITAVEATAGLEKFLWGNVKMHDLKIYLEMLSDLRVSERS